MLIAVTIIRVYKRSVVIVAIKNTIAGKVAALRMIIITIINV